MYISMCFESSKRHDIKKWQSTRWEIQKFLKQTLKFLSKYFAENGKEKLFPNDSSFLSNLKTANTNIFMTI